MDNVRKKLVFSNLALFLGGDLHGRVLEVSPERDTLSVSLEKAPLLKLPDGVNPIDETVSIEHYREKRLTLEGNSHLRIFFPRILENDRWMEIEDALVKILETEFKKGE